MPEFSQRPEDGTHCSPVDLHAASAASSPASAESSPNRVRVSASGSADIESGATADRRQEARDVFQDEPPGPKIGSEANDLEEQARACSTQAKTTTRQGEILAGPPSGENSTGRTESCGE
jgi:hypothetical protein